MFNGLKPPTTIRKKRRLTKINVISRIFWRSFETL